MKTLLKTLGHGNLSLTFQLFVFLVSVVYNEASIAFFLGAFKNKKISYENINFKHA